MFKVSSMKKSHIILAAVPVVCALGGFGAGQLLRTGETATVHQVAKPATPAEGVLHNLAEDDHGTGAAPATTHEAPAHGEQHSAIYPEARIMPASYVPSEDAHNAPAHPAPSVSPVQHKVTSQATPQAHRLDPEILAQHAKEVMLEKTRQEREKALEAKLAKIEAEVTKSTSHPALLPVDVEAEITEDAIKRIAASEDHVVKLGRITLPVEGPAKTTYYVADFGVAVTDMDSASYYYAGENAARLRDQVMLTLHELGPTQIMRSDRVNSDQLAARVTQDLRHKFNGVEEFIFLSLYKTEIPLS